MTHSPIPAPDVTIVLRSGNKRRAWIEFECPGYVVAWLEGRTTATHIDRQMITRIDRG